MRHPRDGEGPSFTALHKLAERGRDDFPHLGLSDEAIRLSAHDLDQLRSCEGPLWTPGSDFKYLLHESRKELFGLDGRDAESVPPDLHEQRLRLLFDRIALGLIRDPIERNDEVSVDIFHRRRLKEGAHGVWQFFAPRQELAQPSYIRRRVGCSDCCGSSPQINPSNAFAERLASLHSDAAGRDEANRSSYTVAAVTPKVTQRGQHISSSERQGRYLLLYLVVAMFASTNTKYVFAVFKK
jgi:hypothetical protein